MDITDGGFFKIEVSCFESVRGCPVRRGMGRQDFNEAPDLWRGATGA
jgi:hypothetical protein